MFCACGGCLNCLEEQEIRLKLNSNLNKELVGGNHVNTFKEDKEEVLYSSRR